MSVLSLDEDAAALAEALAFIDDFSLQSIDIDYAALRGGGQRTENTKRVRDPAVDARRRLRRKQERDGLRQLVKELERELTKVRRAFQPGSELSDTCEGDPSVPKRASKRTALRWFRLLTDEKRKRRDAEALNLLLRSEIETATRAALAMQQCLAQIGLLGAAPVVSRVAGLDAGALSKATDELGQTVQRLYLEAVESWDPALVGSVTMGCRVHSDAEVGAYTETRASAPLDRSLADVSALIRFGILWAKFPTESMALPTDEVTVLSRQSVVELPVPSGVLRLRGVGALLWRQLDDRVVLAYSSLLFHESGGFCFRESGWKFVRASSARECSYQCRSRLASELLGPALDAETAQALSDATDALATRTRAKYADFQRRLLAATGREDLARLTPTA